MAPLPPPLLLLLLLAAPLAPPAAGQSNYASHANNVEYQGEGLPEEATLDGRVTRLDDLSPVIALNRTRAALNCAAGSMHVQLKFRQPFFGRAYADFDRNSACQLVGKGALAYTLELPLKGCGTKQDPQRVFTNNIVVRFHPGLEMDGDEIITVVCRYPPPVAPPPAGLPSYIKEEVAPPAAVEPPLKGLHILLIICAILFLSLLLLGLGCSYVCLKRRNIRVVRRHPLTSAGTGSEITKLSGSSLGALSMFEGLRIPRAHAPAPASVSGSEAQLILAGSRSDTLPSDYPSESPSSAHSEVEDVDTRSLRRPSSVSSAGSYDNKAFVPCPPPLPEPKFDVSVRVKKAAAPPPPPTPPPSDVESTMSVQARNLTTILEREESIRASRPDPGTATTFSYVPEIHSAPSAARYAQTPPVYSRILRKQHEQVVREVAETLSDRSIPDNDNWSQGEDFLDTTQRSAVLAPARSLTSLNTEMTDTRSVSEMVDTSHHRYATTLAPPPPPPPPIAPASSFTSRHVDFTADSAVELLEPPVVAVERRPEITQHIVDDVFLQTITEKRTIEDVERRKRQITEFHSRPQPPSPKWDVVIRNYPDPSAPEPTIAATTDWESYSEASSLSGVPTTPIAERHHVQLMQQHTVLDAPVASDPPPANWDVLIRVLNPPDDPEPIETTAVSVLTVEDRQKWRQIITTESTLRTLLTEATVREDYERIRQDQRYERLFEPHKWDVIIRVLAPPPRAGFDQRGGAGPGGARYKRKQQQQQQEWDTRSRRSSLPTLYEYDSDGGSSVRTLVAEGAAGVHAATAGGPAADGRSRRTSRSSLRSDMDVRSMTEVTVDFARSDRADSLSDASVPSTYGRRRFFDEDEDPAVGPRAGSLARSASQPSLARSGSEFTEHWAAAAEEELSSPEGSPRAGRSQAGRLAREEHRMQVQQQAQQMLQRAAAAAVPPPPGAAREIVVTATTTSVRETYERDWFGPGGR